MPNGRECLRVNGEAIPETEIREQMAAVRERAERNGIELTLEVRMAVREQAIAILVERTLILQEARRLNLMPSDVEVENHAGSPAPRRDEMPGCRAGIDPASVRAEARRQLTVERMVAHWARAVKAPSAGEVRDFHRSNAAEFDVPELVHVSHIAINHESDHGGSEVLEALRLRIAAGEDFGVVAAEHSDCPENGGDLGLIPRGVMVEEFDEIVFAAPAGTVTAPFRTRFAWHIAMVHERRRAGRMPLSDAALIIEDALRRARIDREIGRRLDMLRTSAVIS